ncbi:hypothetical protein K469DRAFT_704846 [Zopfia rhizophila CBS 207.26]|uniref:Uncharacterized protein n=1 Tax=Zopfia rhizophila CBS 207.26 TaxID=1314779 RepID=A0A6A6D5L2_9PEZI|nr:hypothetical protein K469DRAFT_704846 [Zopfia rhizophila CBS 207.26]
MASAQVVLGLTPSILATLGTSPQETAMLSVIAGRPLLAGLLAAGSPAVFALRSFEYARTIEDLHERNFLKPAFFIRLDPVIVILEYLAAAASIGNIVELCYRLGGQVLTAIFTDDQYHFFLWAFLGLVVHGFGALALYLRTKVTTLGRDYEGGHIYRHHGRAAFNQFKPMAQQTSLHILILEESLLFFAVYWFTNILTVCHIIYGTIMFSSMLFISAEDAVIIIFRLMASVMICRIVLTYELANLRRVVKGIERKTIVEDTDATVEKGGAERQGLK